MRCLGVLFDQLEIFADIERQKRQAEADTDLDLVLRQRRMRRRAKRQRRAESQASGEATAARMRPQPAFSSAIGLRKIPTRSISTSMVSPFFIQTGLGLRAWPTPDGVPVKMMSPGSSVMPWVM